MSIFRRILPGLALAVCLAAGVATPASADATLRTSTGTFKLTDPSKLLGETALKSAERTAELAMAAAAQDAAAYDAQQKQLAQDTARYEQDYKAVKAQDDARRAKYLKSHGDYTSKLQVYTKDVQTYSDELTAHRVQVEASNSLPPDKRDPGTVAHLNSWKHKLDAQRPPLEYRKNSLDSWKAELDSEQQDYYRWADKQQQYFQERYDSLIRRQQTLQTKQGEAYRQLEQAYNYSLQIKKILADRYQVPVSTQTPVMTDAAERLKELSGKGFDGNAGKQPLKEAPKGTEFFKGPEKDQAPSR